jgi:hypothetical protein
MESHYAVVKAALNEKSSMVAGRAADQGSTRLFGVRKGPWGHDARETNQGHAGSMPSNKNIATVCGALLRLKNDAGMIVRQPAHCP